jgi:hypothetical protein
LILLLSLLYLLDSSIPNENDENWEVDFFVWNKISRMFGITITMLYLNLKELVIFRLNLNELIEYI